MAPDTLVITLSGCLRPSQPSLTARTLNASVRPTSRSAAVSRLQNLLINYITLLKSPQWDSLHTCCKTSKALSPECGNGGRSLRIRRRLRRPRPTPYCHIGHTVRCSDALSTEAPYMSRIKSQSSTYRTELASTGCGQTSQRCAVKQLERRMVQPMSANFTRLEASLTISGLFTTDHVVGVIADLSVGKDSPRSWLRSRNWRDNSSGN